MKELGTTEWQVGFGGWYRYERNTILRVTTRMMPPRDEEKQWRGEVDFRRAMPDGPALFSLSDWLTVEEAKTWCDLWANKILSLEPACTSV